MAHQLVLNPGGRVYASGLWDREDGGLWVFRRSDRDQPYKAEGAFVPVELATGSSPDPTEVGVSGVWSGGGIRDARIEATGPRILIIDVPGRPYRDLTDDEFEAVQAKASQALHGILVGVGTSHRGRTHSHLVHHLTVEAAQWISGDHDTESEIAVGVVPSIFANET